MEMATLGASGGSEGMRNGNHDMSVGGTFWNGTGDGGAFRRRASHACTTETKHISVLQQGSLPRRSSVATVDYRPNGTKEIGGRPYVMTLALPASGKANQRKISYSEQSARISAALLSAPELADPRTGTLLHTSEKGVIHLTDHPDAIRRIQQRLFKDNVDIPLGDEFVLHQGLYREVKKVHVDKEPSASTSTPSANNGTKGYILIGFKSLDRSFDQLMVDTWKEWTGVRSIELYLPASLGLSSIRFFLRQGTEAHLFMYVVLAECSLGAATPEHHMRLLDFAQRMRVERMNGYISVYRPVYRTPPTPPPQPPIAMWEDVCPSQYTLPHSYTSSPRKDSSVSRKGQPKVTNGLSSGPPKVEI